MVTGAVVLSLVLVTGVLTAVVTAVAIATSVVARQRVTGAVMAPLSPVPSPTKQGLQLSADNDCRTAMIAAQNVRDGEG